MVARVVKDGGHYEPRHCQKIRVQSTPLQCLSCYDTCIPMHPPMPARLCPKFKVCKLCWTCETGQPGLTPLAKHLPTCPAIFELGAVLSNRTKGTVTAILPSGRFRPDPPPTPCGDTNRIMGKRARASNQLSSDDSDLQALTCLRPSFTSESAATADPNLHPRCLRIGSPSPKPPCMLVRRERPVLNRARHDYPDLLHLKSHMHWHLPRAMTQRRSSLQ